mgnify:CR=1 FL=1
MKEKKTMEKTIEIDRSRPEDVHVGDKLYLEGARDRGYTIIKVDDEDGNFPYRVDSKEFMDETTRDAIELLAGTPAFLRLWVPIDKVSRITREVDVPDWPTPKHNGTAYRGADGNLYVYASDGEGDERPWMSFGVNEGIVWGNADIMSKDNTDALPLTELVPKYDAAPEPRHITDIREVRIGFIVFAKGFSTPFVCAFRDNAQRDVSLSLIHT